MNMSDSAHLPATTRELELESLTAQHVAQSLGLTQEELAQALAQRDTGAEHQPANTDQQAKLTELEALAVRLQETFRTPETGQAWLRALNPVLSDQPPMTYLLQGQPDVIERLLNMAETGMPT